LDYLGFENISGKELSRIMENHLKSTGIDIISEEVTRTVLNEEIKTVYTHNHTFQARAVIIGIGTTPRNLGVENEKNFLNKGISYSTLKDREKFENKNVAVVGGGNSAIEDALYLSQKCNKVYIVHRRQEFRGDAQLVKMLTDTPNIELVLDCKPHSIIGDEHFEGLRVLHIPTNTTKDIAVDCVFVAIGRGADTDIIDKEVVRNESGYIVTDEKMNTNLCGVYAVGDIRTTPLRQIVTAVSDGAIAVVSAFNYIKSIKN